jgi:hypothetical protein
MNIVIGEYYSIFFLGPKLKEMRATYKNAYIINPYHRDKIFEEAQAFCWRLILLHTPSPVSLCRQASPLYTERRKTKKGVGAKKDDNSHNSVVLFQYTVCPLLFLNEKRLRVFCESYPEL